MQNKIKPTLSSFRLISMNFRADEVIKSGVEVKFSLETELELGTLIPKKAELPIMHAVRISLKMTGLTNQDSENSVFDCHAVYVARFKLPLSVDKQTSVKLSEDEDFIENLVVQVVPLAISNIKGQVQLAGFATDKIPLGFQEITGFSAESR